MTSPVRKQSDAVAKMAEAWDMLEKVLGGTRTMRAAGKRYLPQWPAEGPEAYQTRLSIATLFQAYGRTVSVLTGKPFSKPVTIGDDVPARLKSYLDDADMQGQNLHTFAAAIAAEALGYGFTGILVDCPPNEGATTVEQERTAGIRPYFVHIRHDQILGWKTQKIGSQLQLSQLRLLEAVEEDDGVFQTKLVPQVRVLEPGKWTTYRKVKPEDDDSWTEFEKGTTSIDVIPFVPVYGRRETFMVGSAPMIDLAYANIDHWQSQSDQQTILHVARVPMMFAKEIGDAKIVVGAGAFVSASSKDADIKYVEHSGKAIEAGRQSLLDLEDRMRQIGAELLVIKPGNTSKAQTLADNEPGMCDLQRIVQSLENSLDQALTLMAKWVGENEGGHVTIYQDFGVATLSEASAQLLFEMKADGSLSHPTLLHEIKRRGILSEDVDVEKEVAAATAELAAREPQRKENVNI